MTLLTRSDRIMYDAHDVGRPSLSCHVQPECTESGFRFLDKKSLFGCGTSGNIRSLPILVCAEFVVLLCESN